MPGDNSFPLASPNAWWRKRAGFVNHHVWVTPYREDERYAGGDYPNQSSGGDGLSKWTEADRPSPRPTWCSGIPSATRIFRARRLPRDADRVHRVPAQAERIFEMNPANDVPPSAAAKKAHSCCS
jgi:primary-amine oxidase